MAEVSKERKQEILQYKIDFCNEKYNNFIEFGISSKKISKMDMLKDEYIAAKAIVDAS